jgi:hypothetical protein
MYWVHNTHALAVTLTHTAQHVPLVLGLTALVHAVGFILWAHAHHTRCEQHSTLYLSIAVRVALHPTLTYRMQYGGYLLVCPRVQ